MIGYLEQLECDLVEAIERREQAGRRLRRRPSVPRLATLAAALVAAAAAVLLIVILPSRPQEHGVTHPPATHRNPRPVHIPPKAPLRIVGTVTRVAPATWQGEAVGPGGIAGALTITGVVDLAPRPCCDTPRHLPPGAVNTIHFRWTIRDGVLEGSIRTSVGRRPHGRFVWDGYVARGARGSGVLRRYSGRAIAIAGDTPISAPNRSRIILSQD